MICFGMRAIGNLHVNHALIGRRLCKMGVSVMSESEKKIITVGNLIELLSTFDNEFFVLIEGCDCIGDACGVEDFEDTDGTAYVLIKRL